MTSPDAAIPDARGEPDPTDLQALDRPRDGRRTGVSLKSRALRLLSRREYTRAELRRKLLLAEEADARKALLAGVAAGPDALEPITEALLECLDSLLDELEGNRLLSDRRYAEVLVSSKGDRYGVARLSRTLVTQGVGGPVADEALAPLRTTQRERALAIWKRRFGRPPSDLRERARQHRFLIGRGFDPATVSWVLKQGSHPPE
jgi:regulatory protein